MRTQKVAETRPVYTVCNGWVMLLACMYALGEVLMMHAQKFPISMYFLCALLPPPPRHSPSIINFFALLGNLAVSHRCGHFNRVHCGFGVCAPWVFVSTNPSGVQLLPMRENDNVHLEPCNQQSNKIWFFKECCHECRRGKQLGGLMEIHHQTARVARSGGLTWMEQATSSPPQQKLTSGVTGGAGKGVL